MNRLKLFILAGILPVTTCLQAQNPKWYKKARKADLLFKALGVKVAPEVYDALDAAFENNG